MVRKDKKSVRQSEETRGETTKKPKWPMKLISEICGFLLVALLAISVGGMLHNVLLFMLGMAIMAIGFVIVMPEKFCVGKMVKEKVGGFMPIKKQYRNIEHLLRDYRDHSLECVQTIVAIDFTRSNSTQGRRTFKGRSLHALDIPGGNPYEQVIAKLGSTLEQLDDDKKIPAYGFGDAMTEDHNVFALDEQIECQGYEGVLTAYRNVVPHVKMSGPTNFGPAIRTAIGIVKEKRRHHVLIIITDGQVDTERDTEDAIVEASNYPISIIAIGVGDGDKNGNFGTMEKYDDELPERKFDNFQFVKWQDFIGKHDDEFTMAAMEELPHQMRAMRKLRLL